MFNFSIRSFLWFLSVVTFFWLCINIYKFKTCESLRKQEQQNKKEAAATGPLLQQKKKQQQHQLNENSFYVQNNKFPRAQIANTPQMTSTAKPRVFVYNNKLPIVFVVGIAGSGLKLMGSLLSQSPYMRCGNEAIIINSLIQRRHEWSNSNIERKRLQHAGMTDHILDAAVLAFIMEVVLKEDIIANRLCNVDAELFHHAKYVHRLMPNAKFVMMIRDARATSNSIIRNGYELKGSDGKDYKDVLLNWNKVMETFTETCRNLGEKTCVPVFYEELVLNTNRTIKRVLKFLDVTEIGFGSREMLNFPKDSLKSKRNVTDFIEVRKSKIEAWIDEFPPNLMAHVTDLAPMMNQFGYDTSTNGIASTVKSYFNLKFD